MGQATDWRLEMSLMLPAALADGDRRSPMPKTASGGLRLKVERRRQEMAVILHGSADADIFLERLLAIIRLSSDDEGLFLDLAQAEDFDHLSLSALVVVLRDQAGKFQRLILSGLPSWASLRLFHTGAENLLGRSWKGNFAPGMVSFFRV
jgi:hypothetical protein